jgi:3-phosphoshikimate 1-carboxyvinyltransferase
VKGNVKEHPLRGIDIDCTDIPDLFPILSIIGAFAKGKTVLFNASHLKYKESNRISIINRELQKFGVKTEVKDDGLTIYYCEILKGTHIKHENDHRIAMSLIIAALFAKAPSQMHNSEIINDSYPEFVNHLRKLGANINSKKDNAFYLSK